ncbi:MAG: hypothetical protein WC509_00210 [Candidatus Izemoplasmatales bacterium]
MKKLLLCVFTLVLTLTGFAALQVDASRIREEAVFGGTQQTAEAVTATVTSYFDGDNDPSQNVTSTYGTTLSVTNKIADYTGYTFYCWIVNGEVRTDLPIDHAFTMTSNLDLKAIFYPNGTNSTTLQYPVVFMDSNGEMLKIQYVLPDGAATAPESLPTKLGYSVSETPWSVAFATVTAPTVTVLQYAKTGDPYYTVTVENGTGGGSTAYNAVATVTANAAPDGQTFHHWEMQDQTVSYSSTWSFTVVEDVTVTAYYATSAPADQPRVFLTNDLALRSGYKTFIGQFTLPSGYTLVEWGVVTTAAANAMTDIGTASVIRNKSTKYTSSTKEFVISVANANAGSYRGYLVCKNASQELVTVYSENAYNVVNGGFETGTIVGWNRYSLWKDESGMQAFADAVITNSTQYTAYEGDTPNTSYYDGDGSYVAGIGSGNKDTMNQYTERMGYLRSSDFVLGGSGWISFKMGGGQSNAFAYVSVRKTSDNTEIARFGNPNFNNTTIASTQYGSSITYAKAFLYQYYFDLGSVGTTGETYYVILADTAGYNWSIVAFDSLVTYHAVAPTPGSDQTATNILPNIPAIGASTYTVSNALTATVSNWEDPAGIFQWSERARTNVSCGDSCLGVVRSSRFTYDDTYDYLKWSWEGNISQDKQLFVSIKELGTNIEVLRLVRRNNLSGKTGGGADAHWYDVTSYLTVGKQYYVELSDNTTSGWGLISVDNVRFSNNHSVTADDVAVRVTGIPTSFIYVKPF